MSTDVLVLGPTEVSLHSVLENSEAVRIHLKLSGLSFPCVKPDGLILYKLKKNHIERVVELTIFKQGNAGEWLKSLVD